MSHPELYILRHGETEWNAARRVQGQHDSALTALGRTQAAWQGAILAAAGALHLPIFVSPQGRARATAEIALPGRPATVDDRLREISLGLWDGLTRDEIERRWPSPDEPGDPFFWYDSAPEGEGFAAVAARVGGFLDDLTGPAVIVTHGIASMFLRGRLLGLDLDGIGGLPGGQGVVYHLKYGRQRRLD
jgi:probable phosphoglycerate mutase